MVQVHLNVESRHSSDSSLGHRPIVEEKFAGRRQGGRSDHNFDVLGWVRSRCRWGRKVADDPAQTGKDQDIDEDEKDSDNVFQTNNP